MPTLSEDAKTLCGWCSEHQIALAVVVGLTFAMGILLYVLVQIASAFSTGGG